MSAFEGMNFNGFWDNSPYSNGHYKEIRPDEQLITEIEAEVGYRLPDAYVDLMRRQNGGLLNGQFFPLEGDKEEDIQIRGILGMGRTKMYSLCGVFGNRYWIREWGYPPIGLAICTTPSSGHEMIFLDYRKCGRQGEPSVVLIDQEDNYRITELAPDFETFIRGLRRK